MKSKHLNSALIPPQTVRWCLQAHLNVLANPLELAFPGVIVRCIFTGHCSPPPFSIKFKTCKALGRHWVALKNKALIHSK